MDWLHTLTQYIPVQQLLLYTTAVACPVLAWVLTRFAFSIIKRQGNPAPLLDKLRPATWLIISVVLLNIAALWFPEVTAAKHWWQYLETSLLALASVLLLLRGVDYLEYLLQRGFSGNKTAQSLIMPIKRMLKILLLILFVLFWLQNLGFNVAAVLAGLGIGGIAIALASQKSVENLFGGIMLATDQPVRIGDLCRYADGKMGTVEDIGLRSVRLRTLDNTLVSIPNAAFVEMPIENFGARHKTLLHTTIALRYETTPDQIRTIVAETRKLLLSHRKIDNDPARVRFIGFSPSSLDIEVFAYVRTSDWNEHLAVREDIFLQLMDIIHAAGSGFAFPSQTVYMRRDAGLDAGKTAAIVQAMQHARSNNIMPSPDWSDSQRQEFQDSLDWPPTGSVVNVQKK